VVSSDPASPERVDLTGQGLGVFLNPAQLSFGSQAVGTTSAPMTVTLTNENSFAVLMGTITATDDFIVSSNKCPATLATGQSCAVQVEFAPDETGSIGGTLFISDSDPNSPQELALSGTGD